VSDARVWKSRGFIRVLGLRYPSGLCIRNNCIPSSCRRQCEPRFLVVGLELEELVNLAPEISETSSPHCTDN
jgi:hypothetical protein